MSTLTVGRVAETSESLGSLVGVVGGVRRRADRPTGERTAWIAGATGTLVETGSRYSRVDFGERGRWTVETERLQPAE